MPWPFDEDPDSYDYLTAEPCFKNHKQPESTPKETSEKEVKPPQRGPKGNGPPMQVYRDYY